MDRVKALWRRFDAEARTRDVYLVAAAIGLLVNLLMLGPGHLFGTSDYWDMPDGDSRQYIMGYRYFLSEPWRWPLFEVHTMTVPYTKSIAFADAMPGFAFVNKLIATVVPPWRTFSARAYLGLWHGMTYALQSAFAVANLRALGRRDWRSAVLGALFFVAIPPFVMRYGHASLAAHFLLLWALSLYFRSTRMAGRWTRASFVGQLVVAAFLNPYHAVMSYALFAASLVRARDKRSLLWLPVGIAAPLAAAWVEGFFSADVSKPREGFDLYSTNFLSLVVPLRSSVFGHGFDFIKVDPTNGQYEGYGYMGAGGLLLVALFLRHPTAKARPVIRREWPLAVVAITFFLLALSNRVYIADSLVLEYPWPKFLTFVKGQFRCPGRFVWLPEYILLLLLFRWALSAFEQTWRITVPIVTIVQLFDVGFVTPGKSIHEVGAPAWAAVAATVHNRGKDFELDHRVWRPLIHAHRAISFYRPIDCLRGETYKHDFEKSLELQYIASERALTINGIFLARLTRDCAADDRALDELVVKDDTLYVLMRDRAIAAARLASQGAVCGTMPFGAVCTKNAQALAAATNGVAIRGGIPSPTLKLGERIRAGRTSQDTFFELGWWEAENNGSWQGRWSSGPEAVVTFIQAETPASATPMLHIDLETLICRDRAEEIVDVIANGIPLGTLAFPKAPDGVRGVHHFPLAPSLTRPGPLRVTLRAHDVRSPRELGCGNDERRLGVFLRELWIE